MLKMLNFLRSKNLSYDMIIDGSIKNKHTLSSRNKNGQKISTGFLAEFLLLQLIHKVERDILVLHWALKQSDRKMFCAQGCYAFANPWAHSNYSAQDNLSCLSGHT